MNFLYFHIFLAASSSCLFSPNHETIEFRLEFFVAFHILWIEELFTDVPNSYPGFVPFFIFNSYGNSSISSITKGMLDLRPGMNGNGFAI